MIGIIDQRLDILVPARKVGFELIEVARLGPGLHVPAILLHHAHTIHQLTTPQVVVYEVLVRAPPGGGDRWNKSIRQALSRHQRTPTGAPT